MFFVLTDIIGPTDVGQTAIELHDQDYFIFDKSKPYHRSTVHKYLVAFLCVELYSLNKET